MTKRSKKVLIITYYWPPSGGAGVQRWVKFCKYLPQFGWEPVVLTVKNGTYPLIDQTLEHDVSPSTIVERSSILEPYTLFGKLTGKNSKEVATPSKAFSSDGSRLKQMGIWVRSNIFIPDARVGWYPFGIRKARSIIRTHGIDTVITTAPPHSTHLIGHTLKKSTPELTWIMDMRDPWSEIFYNQYLPRLAPAKALDLFLETSCLTLADHAILATEGMKTVQERILNRDYHVITNGFDPDDFPERTKEKKNPVLTIKHVGTLTSTAIPHTLFKALATSAGKDWKLVFVGSVNPEVEHIVQSLGITEHVEHTGYLPHLKAKEEMQDADLLLVSLPEGKDNKLIMTGKIFDYIGAKRPILLIGATDGDAARTVNDYALGHTFEHNDTEGISIYIETILNRFGTHPDHFSVKGIEPHPFSRKVLTERLVNTVLNPGD